MKISSIFNEILIENSELKELYGISFEARSWTPIIKSHIKIGRKYLKHQQEPPRMIIRGAEYPKQYKAFPVDEIDIFVAEKYKDGASYDEKHSGYDENKKYKVIIYFGPNADDSSINHELRHAYEDFMSLSRGGVPLKNTKEGLNLFGGDFEEFLLSGRYYSPFWLVMYGLYITSKIERSGYTETIYDNSFNAIYLIRDSIQSTNISNLLKYDTPERLEQKWKEMKSKFKIPIIDKYNNYESFLRWASDEIKYKGERSIKKLQKVKFHREQNKNKGSE